MNIKKSFFYFFIVCLGVFVSQCSVKRIPISGETEYLSPSEAGTILVKSIGKGETISNALENAEVRAIENLLFRGIPGSQYQLPMIANEQEVKKNYSTYFKKLLSERSYQKFVLDSKVLNSYDLIKKDVMISLKINVDALRRDLENNNIIRKFGI